eukprot:scaffold56975_cov30-Prasinocladus_malaysianus.AAC.1
MWSGRQATVHKAQPALQCFEALKAHLTTEAGQIRYHQQPNHHCSPQQNATRMTYPTMPGANMLAPGKWQRPHDGSHI